MKNISFKLIFRSWWRNKTFTVISILSLAVGIACTNLLAAFVIHEYNIEANNPNRDRIVVLQKLLTEINHRFITYQPAHFPELFISEVPELDRSCTINDLSGSTFKVGEYVYTGFKIFETDTNFIRLFPQQVLMGSLEEALNDPNKIVLSESSARQLFGSENPVGQMIRMQKMSTGFPGDIRPIQTLTVSAIVKNDHQAALMFDAFFFGRPTTGIHLFLLKENTSIAQLQAKTKNQFKNHSDSMGRNVQYTFLSIPEVCFDKELYSFPFKKPNTAILWVALISAIMILVIACFNYINLSFSRVFNQLYSLHIQKLMGAGIRQLQVQLFADTWMTVGLGFLIAQLLQYDLLSILNSIMSAGVPASFLYTNQVLPVTLGLILVLAFIPALYMGSRLPGMTIAAYNNFYRGKAKQRIIALLAVTQFVISLVLIIGTFSVRRQLSLLYEKTEHYKNIYAFSVGDNQTSMRPLIDRVAHLPGIQAIGSSSATLDIP